MEFQYKAGQTVWLSPGGNYARSYKHCELPFEAEVTAIKRKYFYVKRKSSSHEEKFDIQTGESICEDCNSSWTIWPTKEAYLSEMKRLRQVDAIYKAVRDHRFKRLVSAQAADVIYEALAATGLIVKEEENT